MLFRFCLYSFLKSQRYFEAFIVLAFLERGLTFLQIGGLVAFREVMINLMELPSGGVADTLGRRRAMVISQAGYVLAFVIFGLAWDYYVLYVAMFFFACGEAFRTGTHKAMIFAWLKEQGLGAQKTRYYGYTRSWAKYGDAVSVLAGAAAIFIVRDYSVVFYLSALPALVNMINLIGYPASLDGGCDSCGLRDTLRVLYSGMRNCLRTARLRMLLAETFCFDGLYETGKDYLQPALRALALALPVLTGWDDKERTVLVVAVVYALLNIASGLVSRHSHSFADYFGTARRSLNALWLVAGGASLLIIGGAYWALTALVVAGFVLLIVAQNLWRPQMLGQIAEVSREEELATVMSVDSQGTSFFTAGAALVLGWSVDRIPEGMQLLPVGGLGLLCFLLALAFFMRREHA